MRPGRERVVNGERDLETRLAWRESSELVGEDKRQHGEASASSSFAASVRSTGASRSEVPSAGDVHAADHRQRTRCSPRCAAAPKFAYGFAVPLGRDPSQNQASGALIECSKGKRRLPPY